MNMRSAHFPTRATPVPDALPPGESGVHLVHRTAGPPLRITGRRMFHIAEAQGRGPLFISIWDIASPGHVLQHSRPDLAPDACVAYRIDGVPAAIYGLETFCSELSRLDHAGSSSDIRNSAFDAFIRVQAAGSRTRSFLSLAGRAIVLLETRYCDVPTASSKGAYA